jgi:hypothetical protein
MNITTDELRILLRINGAASYKTTINEVTNVTNNYNKTCTNLISTLAKLVSAGAIVKFSKQCIEAASNLQEVANVVDVTFGRNANKINDWAKSQAASFGLSETAAKRYAGTYGTMAKQFNMTSDQAATMAIELTKLTGDLASFYNIEDKVAATKLKAIFTGETEGLKELGVVMTETQLNSYAMTKGLGKTTKEMTEQEKVLLRYQYTMEKLGHAQGDFARTSDGYANSTRTLKLELENLKVEIGKELIPVASMGIQAISKGLQAISPFLISVAQTVKYYAQAWQQASDTTKTYVQLSLAAFGIMIVAPKIIAVTSAAVKLLTMDIVTLGGALKALLGIAGIALAILALADLTESVEAMKQSQTADEIKDVSNSLDTLDESIENLGESSNAFDTFLASFDEVNKIGGSSTLASKIVNADDVANILDLSNGIGDIQKSLDNLTVSIPTPRILTKDFWVEVGGYVKGFIEDIKKGNFFKDWEIGADAFDKKLRQLWPEWADFYKRLGEAVYDALHPKEYAAEVAAKAVENPVGNGLNPSSEGLENFKNIKWSKHAAGGFPNKGSLFLAGETGAELVGSFGGSQTRVVNRSQMGGINSTTPIVLTPTIAINGRAITSVVLDDINNMTRSSGNSPLIELGG